MKTVGIFFLFFSTLALSEPGQLVSRVTYLESQVIALNEKVAKLQDQLEAYIGKTTKKEFYCEASVFTSTYKAFGPTELETRDVVKEKCMAGNNGSDFHCKDIKCRKNE